MSRQKPLRLAWGHLRCLQRCQTKNEPQNLGNGAQGIVRKLENGFKPSKADFDLRLIKRISLVFNESNTAFLHCPAILISLIEI